MTFTNHGRFFDEIAVGDKYRTAYRTICDADLAAFISLNCFVHDVFLDARASADAGLGRLVPGSMTFSFSEGLILQTGFLHYTAVAFLGAEIKCLSPVRVGDTIRVDGEIVSVRPSSNGRSGTVSGMNRVRNQDDVIVLEYLANRLIRRKDEGVRSSGETTV